MGLTFDQFITIASLDPILVVDTESDPITDEFLGISVSVKGFEDGFYWGVECQEENERLSANQQECLRELFRTRDALVFHNAAYDLKRLQRKFNYRHEGRFYDTMLMIHWVNENLQNYSLDAQSRAYGGKPKNRSPQMQFIIDHCGGWRAVPFSLMRQYSGNDAWITRELFDKVYPEFISQGFDSDLWHVWECRFIWIIADMIELGVKIDLDFCVREMIKGQDIMAQLQKELHVNPASSNGLENLLIKQLGLPVMKLTPGGKPSFDKEAMEQYDIILENKDDPRAKKILRYRGWQKAVGYYKAYINLRDGENVLHPGYKIHGTETGRMSCANPNLQQIPKASVKEWNGNLKKAIIAREGFGLWEFDYSQLEFRLTCAYADQYDLIEVFNDDERDIFDEMAEAMSWLRQNVKTLVYLILFGGGANRAKSAFSLETIEEAKELVEEFHTRYPGIRKISRKAQNLASTRGYVQYWTGRRRHFPKGSKYYRAFNSIIQGGEAEIVKRAMIKLAENVCNPEQCRMVLQVHDSIVFEIKTGMESEYFPKIKEAMETVDYDFGVRFKVDGKKWGEAA